MKHVVVIGAGQAGASCVAKLRTLGYEGRITLIGREPAPPYQRPPLSKKYLLGEMTAERLYLRPPNFYAENDIELQLGRDVSAIDPKAQTVTLDEKTLPFSDLVLTTGSTPRLLPAAIGGTLENVFAVRSLQDVDAMQPAFHKGGHVLIIGGGYIGLETAAVAAQKGLKVTVVEMAERILARVACLETSDYFRHLHQSHGVQILEGVGLEKLLGNAAGQASGAGLTNGQTLDIDFAVVGVGIMPETALAETAGLTLENGIKTDAQGQTSAPHIWAAGDCASFPYQGERTRLESVPNAIDQAEVVAQNIMGAAKDYIAKPWFWSDQYDVKLQIAGLNTGYDKIVVRDGGAARSHWYYTGDQLLAVDAMNDPRSYMLAKRLIEAGKTVPLDMAANPQSDLKSLL